MIRCFMSISFLLFLALTTAGCDPEGRRKCDWVLEGEPDLIGNSREGFIPVCARNRVTMRQDCRLQATLDFAKGAADKKFRYVDIRVDKATVPRTVVSISYCRG